MALPRRYEVRSVGNHRAVRRSAPDWLTEPMWLQAAACAASGLPRPLRIVTASHFPPPLPYNVGI